MTTITRTTIARKIRELFAEEKHYGQWSRGGNNLLSDSEYRQIAYKKAWEELVPAFTWPGGYAVEYIAAGEFILCADCARAYLKTNRGEYCDRPRLDCQSTDGYEGDDSADHLCCEDCGAIIARAWLRPEGHADDADLPWSLLRHLRAEDSGTPLDSRKRYQPRHWSGKRRTRAYAHRHVTRVATLAIWRFRKPA